MTTGRDPLALDERHVIGLNNFVQKTIKRFSHARHKEENNRYADNDFAIAEPFILGILVSVFGFISGGISESSKNRDRICPYNGAFSKIYVHLSARKSIKNCEKVIVHFWRKCVIAIISLNKE
jgi:hypothetical protein